MSPCCHQHTLGTAYLVSRPLLLLFISTFVWRTGRKISTSQLVLASTSGHVINVTSDIISYVSTVFRTKAEQHWTVKALPLENWHLKQKARSSPSPTKRETRTTCCNVKLEVGPVQTECFWVNDSGFINVDTEKWLNLSGKPFGNDIYKGSVVLDSLVLFGETNSYIKKISVK